MRTWLLLVVLFFFGLGCKPPGDDSNNLKPVATSPIVDPLREPFDAGQDATEWLMDTKNTLRGVGLPEAQELCKKLLDMGAVEMRVDDIRPDPADPSYKSAGRLIVKGPRNADQRKAILDFAAQHNGEAPPKSIDTEFAQFRFNQ